MTTNATRLADHADALVAAGMRRINVSLDSRDPQTFRHITRHGDVARVLAGIAAARAAGLAIKINMVALKGPNEHEIEPMRSEEQTSELKSMMRIYVAGFCWKQRTKR